MTQAYNLSQLANNLDSTGRLDATDGLVNSVPVANGGTGASSAAAARSNLGVPSVEFVVPSGGIIMWSGSVALIPSGWLLCNGSNGTPDLRNRFVIGAGDSYAVNASGGSKDAYVVSHSHTTGSSGTHSHFAAQAVQRSGYPGTPTSSSSIATSYYGGGPTNEAYILAPGTSTADVGLTSQNGSHTHTVSTEGGSGVNGNLPPYYALCFIMKS